MINPSSQMVSAASITQVQTGTEQQEQITRLGSNRVAQLEQNGFEVGRVNRSWVACISLVAGGVVPVGDLPPPTGPVVVDNAEPQGTGKLLHVKHVSAYYASGTEGAAGFGIFGGVT